MAGRGGSRSGGDRVLESRHLVGLFLGVVLLCAVFFTLGYVMGRTQFAHVNANSPAGRDTVNGFAPTPPATHPDPFANSVSAKWNFDDKTNVLQPQPAATKPAASTPAATSATAVAKPAKPPATTKPAPPINTSEAKELKQYAPPNTVKRNSVVLQLAALSKTSDALSMVEELRQKHFPSFVTTVPTDTLYHVQVGPYPDIPSAEKAKDALDHAGFKAIIKR